MMRSTALVVAAFVVAMSSPSFAAKSTTDLATWKAEQTSDPQGFQACVDLAKQRGYSAAQDRGSGNSRNPGLRKFVEGCMAGRFH